MQITYKRKWQITAKLDDAIVNSLNQYNNPTLYESLFHSYKLKIEVNQFEGLLSNVDVNLNESELVVKVTGPIKIEDLKGKRYPIPQLKKKFPKNYIAFI